MICPKCQHENPETARFCVRCHMTLRFSCPACTHVQDHAGSCDRCGIDYLKYAAVIESEMEGKLRDARERRQRRGAILKQVVLLPVTGGFSLLKSLKSTFARE
jgi:Double zinc ribbon